MSRRYFGTDGVRGTVGIAPITADFVLKLGWAAGRVLAGNTERRGRIIVGKDTRISGYMFESALEAGLTAAGVDTHLVGPMPTPGIAYLTRTLHADAGIVISASHNPHYDNGIKFFSGEGTKLPDEIELAIEAELDKPMETVRSTDLGKACRVNDAAGRYIEFCKSTIPMRTNFRGMKIVLDCAHGATYHIAPHVFDELGADVISIGTEPNGLNINDKVGATYPETLRKAVLEQGADLGIALDGDGDRLIMVDQRGEVVDGDELLYILARARQESNQLKGPVVGTLMSNLGLEHALENMGLSLERASVGDRYVMERLLEKGGLVGGESSGHIICLDRTSTGDGIVSALQILATINETGRSLHELKSGMQKYPQEMINVKVTDKSRLKSCPAIDDAVLDVSKRMQGRGRVLLRPSGTEPVIRVMVEGQDGTEVRAMAEELAGVVEQNLC